MDTSESRREFVRRAVALTLAPVLASPRVVAALAATGAGRSAGEQQDSLAGRGAVGTLRDPSAAGRPLLPSSPQANEVEIQAIETRLACNCGCTLDVFTCRTTDFSCTYSPRLHREVLALRNQGLSAQQVLDAFVAKYGEKALMAPKPAGFNLAGYLVPGVAIAAAGAALVVLIGRRRRVAAEAGASPPAEVHASPDELERLRRALAEVED
jgi:cytochrome c-type biogenesis protein CcmH